MCYFITATMAPGGDEAAVRRLAKNSLLNWVRLRSPKVEKHLVENELYFLTTRGMCDCSTEIGAFNRPDIALPSIDRDFSRDINKLRKKGWSEAKVDRWIEQAKAEATRRHAVADARLAGPHPELSRWVDFISGVLRGEYSKWIGLILHWYSGNIERESIGMNNRVWVSLEDFTEDFLLRADSDVLYSVPAVTPR